LLNAGWYKALVDETKCDTSGDTSGAAPTNPDGAASVEEPTQQQYGDWVITSTKANDAPNTPGYVSGYVTTLRGEKFQAKAIIYEGASDQNQQLGLFDLFFSQQ
jgi:hypothetical protein